MFLLTLFRTGFMWLALAGNAVSQAGDQSDITDPNQLINPATAFPDDDLRLPPSTPWPHLQRDMDPQPDCGETSYIGSGRLLGRKALITGDDSGIGRAVAIAYAREGANVTINYLPEEQPDADDVADLLSQEGLTIHLIPGDLLNETFCAELVTQAHAAMGGLDIVVNNAGYAMKPPVIRTIGTDIRFVNNHTTSGFDRTLRTNLYAPFFINRAAVPLMPPGGSILFTSSGTAVNPLPYGWDYSGTKAAVNAMIIGLARQLVPLGIRINAVAAGLTYTPFLMTEGYNTTQMFATTRQ